MRRKPVQGPVHSMDQDSVESLEDEDNFVQPHEDHPGRARSGGEEEDGMGSTASTNTTDENLMRDHSLSGWTDSRLHIVNPDEKASKSLIITNVDSEIFDNPVAKEMFEKLFTEYDDDVIFHYLKSFGRVRIDLSSAKAASNAKERSHNLVICGKVINCYFLQMSNVDAAPALDLKTTGQEDPTYLALEDARLDASMSRSHLHRPVRQTHG
ncbi:hypothetical protein TCAL_14772 [Tigriopus californicus]|uniref:RRM domain-containing protein n=1 Tax=Tigriopus californicus TaxID=6832 RepID=A0A553PIH9_TIGCA|nr:hypothetical protein TCAL_14772 [Tigriopus californicus]